MNRNLVLVGPKGSGKSSTGNSIVGRKVFNAADLHTRILTQRCQVETTKLNNGQIINVIDTPGFFDTSQFEFDEIIKCVEKVSDGIHAFLLPLSIRNRFSNREETAIENFRTIFGEKFIRYVVVVFTGGDDLEDIGITLQQYLGTHCPRPLVELIRETQNECVVFDNYTRDPNKRRAQVQELISTVDAVASRGETFMANLIELQARVDELRENAKKYDNHANEQSEPALRITNSRK